MKDQNWGESGGGKFWTVEGGEVEKSNGNENKQGSEKEWILYGVAGMKTSNKNEEWILKKVK